MGKEGRRGKDEVKELSDIKERQSSLTVNKGNSWSIRIVMVVVVVGVVVVVVLWWYCGGKGVRAGGGNGAVRRFDG